MIKKLSIKGFKSIRQLDLDCRRVNVFIGEPNTGKTNILEALGLWSAGVWPRIRKVCRCISFGDLFYNRNVSNDIVVSLDDKQLTGMLLDRPRMLRFVFTGPEDTIFSPTYSVKIDPKDEESPIEQGLPDKVSKMEQWPFTRYYLFDPNARQDEPHEGWLSAPFGENLSELLATDREARLSTSKFFADQQYKLTVDRANSAVMMAREEDGTFVTLPYTAVSETIRRMIFFHLALETNENISLVFDEPEAHAFPPYTKRLAERIAADDRGNQFFLTTHSPYMLDSLLSKTPAEDLNVVLCRMENFETKAYPLDEEQIGKLMEWSMDAFFNFDRLIEVPA